MISGLILTMKKSIHHAVLAQFDEQLVTEIRLAVFAAHCRCSTAASQMLESPMVDFLNRTQADRLKSSTKPHDYSCDREYDPQRDPGHHSLPHGQLKGASCNTERNAELYQMTQALDSKGINEANSTATGSDINNQIGLPRKGPA